MSAPVATSDNQPLFIVLKKYGLFNGLLACHKLDLTVDTELLPLSTAVEYLVDLFGEQEGDNYLILNDQKISLRDKNALKDQVKKIEQ